MKSFSIPLSSTFFKLLCALALSFFAAHPVAAEDLKMDVQLIWGTNDEKSPNPKHKPVDDALDKKLKKIFKWKHYFAVKRQQLNVPSRQAKKVDLSEKCSIEIVELEGPKVEVRLFGEGKLINKTTKGLTRGEIITLAGEDKEETAWFVILQQLD